MALIDKWFLQCWVCCQECNKPVATLKNVNEPSKGHCRLCKINRSSDEFEFSRRRIWIFARKAGEYIRGGSSLREGVWSMLFCRCQKRLIPLPRLANEALCLCRNVVVAVDIFGICWCRGAKSISLASLEEDINFIMRFVFDEVKALLGRCRNVVRLCLINCLIV